MPNLNELLRLNPRAATGFDQVRETMASLNELRAAGIANRPMITRPNGSTKSLGELKSSQRRGIFK